MKNMAHDEARFLSPSRQNIAELTQSSEYKPDYLAVIPVLLACKHVDIVGAAIYRDMASQLMIHLTITVMVFIAEMTADELSCKSFGRCCKGRADNCIEAPQITWCFCDEYCIENGDCCSDYNTTCGDVCRDEPCKNGGVCKKSGYGYICECKPGYTGETCTEADVCHDEPCKNGGVCKKSGSSYICECKPGYTGETCNENRKNKVEEVAKKFVKNIAVISTKSATRPTTNKQTVKPINSNEGSDEECDTNEDAGSDETMSVYGKPCGSSRRKRSEHEQSDEELKSKRDVLFLIDESISIGDIFFAEFLRLAQALIGNFCEDVDIGEDKTRIAVVSFDSTHHVHVDFNHTFDKDKLLADIGNINYTENTSHFTCLGESLRFVNDEIFTEYHGARANDEYAEQIIFLFTDGCAHCPSQKDRLQKLKQTTEKLTERGIAIIIFLVGELEQTAECKEEIKMLQDGSRCDQLFKLESWKDVDLAIEKISSDQCIPKWSSG